MNTEPKKSRWEQYKEKNGVTPLDLLNPKARKIDESHAQGRMDICKACPELIQLTDQCKKCGSKYNWNSIQYCVMPACKDVLVTATTEENFYTIQYTKPFDGRDNIVAEDHSGQVKGQDRKIKENKFKKKVKMAHMNMNKGIIRISWK